MAISIKAYLADFKGKTIWSTLLPIFIAFYLLFSMISISLSQIFLFFSFLFWLGMLIKEKQKFTFPTFFWPLIAYVALSLLSVAFSVNPKISLKDSKELLLFLIVLIVYTCFFNTKIANKVNLALLLSGYTTCLYSFFFYFFKAKPWDRIEGFMTHSLTQGGVLLLFSCMALSVLLFSRDKIRYLWGFGFLLSIFALVLTRSRSAWIGLILSVCFILVLYKPKTLIFVPIAIGLLYFISPQQIKKRALTIFNPSSKSDKLRIEYAKVGLKIISEYPFFGTGPDTVDIVYQDPKYGLSEDAKKNVHLHNNILQTAAERGVPTLIVWLTFMIMTFLMLLKLIKNKDPTLLPFAIAALAALIGLNVAGLFEYNFADSEITALFLYIITVPFALSRIQEKTADT